MFSRKIIIILIGISILGIAGAFFPSHESKSVNLNLTWTSKEMIIKGEKVQYTFGSGNPSSVNKTREELEDMSRLCIKNDIRCRHDEYGSHELVGGSAEASGVILSGKPSLVTEKLENDTLTLLSSPLIRESSKKCGKYFFTYDQAYSIFGSEIGDILQWWDPYSIDINTIITINPKTGRKEFEYETLGTFKTQIHTNSVQAPNYANIQLQECLEKNGILEPLKKLFNMYDSLLDEYGRG